MAPAESLSALFAAGSETLARHASRIALVCLPLMAMGAVLGSERELLPLMAQEVFGQDDPASALSFIVTFGVAKAVANMIVGPLSDSHGRRKLLIIGCAITLPVPLVIVVAQHWWHVTAVHVLLGIGQGLVDSVGIFMLIDIMGPNLRGLAVGAGECVIYSSMAIFQVIFGALASKYGFRPVPFLVCAFVAAMGLLFSFYTKETMSFAFAETVTVTTPAPVGVQDPDQDQQALVTQEERERRQGMHQLSDDGVDVDDDDETDVLDGTQNHHEGMVMTARPSFNVQGIVLLTRQVWAMARMCAAIPGMVGCIVVGCVNNMKDGGLLWGLLPLFFKAQNVSESTSGDLTSLYAIVWGVGQLFTGTLSDRYGRRIFITAGGRCAIGIAAHAYHHSAHVRR